MVSLGRTPHKYLVESETRECVRTCFSAVLMCIACFSREQQSPSCRVLSLTRLVSLTATNPCRRKTVLLPVGRGRASTRSAARRPSSRTS